MEVERIDQSKILLSQLDSTICHLLRGIRQSADATGSEAAHARLFSPPSEDLAEEELIEDWHDYVHPEMQQLFTSALEVIERDLRGLKVNSATQEAALLIPLEHLEQWIHGLNQARLALAARHGFTEEELDRVLPFASEERGIALVQIRFYGILQELFLHELDGS